MAETENQVPDSTSAPREQPRPEPVAAESKPEEPADQPAKPRPPRVEYEIVASKRDEPESTFMAEHYVPVAVDGVVARKAVEGEAAVPQARLSKATIERIHRNLSRARHGCMQR